MKELPILFSAPMVRAILDGRKTVTRRIVKHPHLNSADRFAFDAERGTWELGETHQGPVAHVGWMRCPYGVHGDRLWVRETFAPGVSGCEEQGGVSYRADHVDPRGDGPAHPMTWTPSIHMPRWASRITLEIINVRVERLRDITEDDARAEGVERFSCGRPSYSHVGCCGYRTAFQGLWDSINGEHAYARNPWVWRVAFWRLP